VSPGTPFPALPEDTSRSAQEVFGKGNVYLTIGDRLGALFSSDQLFALNTFPKKVAFHPALLVLITCFQFSEGLADCQTTDAVRKRLDLKYALHLPLIHPGFEPCLLCDFRRWILSEPAAQHPFQEITNKLIICGLLTPAEERPVEVPDILNKVCTLSRLEKLLEMMFLALEALAISQPDRLREIAKPDWYRRYTRRGDIGRLPGSIEEQQSLAAIVGQDAAYLLAKAAKGTPGKLVQPELISLDRFLHIQFERYPGDVYWRSQCQMHTCNLHNFPMEVPAIERSGD
jgi:hypothetical protein